MHVCAFYNLSSFHKSFSCSFPSLGIKAKTKNPSYLYIIKVDKCFPQRYTLEYPIKELVYYSSEDA